MILRVKISRTSNGLIFSQSHYIDKILEKFNKNNSSIAKTLLNVNLHLSKNKGKNVSQVEYSMVIESLLYLMSCTRPNIIYTISKLSKYTSNPSINH